MIGPAGLLGGIKHSFDIGGAGILPYNKYPFKIGLAGLIGGFWISFDIGPAWLLGYKGYSFMIGLVGLLGGIKYFFIIGPAGLLGGYIRVIHSWHFWSIFATARLGFHFLFIFHLFGSVPRGKNAFLLHFSKFSFPGCSR